MVLHFQAPMLIIKEFNMGKLMKKHDMTHLDVRYMMILDRDLILVQSNGSDCSFSHTYLL